MINFPRTVLGDSVYAMKRKFDFAVGEYYHAYSRGTDKRKIFMDDKDRGRFIDLLYLCNGHRPIAFRDIEGHPRGPSSGKLISKTRTDIFKFEKGLPLVSIGAYCLMSNHFHLVLYEKEDGGISKFMKKLLTAYSMYFNLKHKRKGALFEGRFRAIHINTSEYLEYLFAYIHLNPIKLVEPKWRDVGLLDTPGAISFLEGYKHSSYLDFIGKSREEGKILDRGAFPEYFSTSKGHKDFVEFWLKYNEQFPEDGPRE